MAHRLCPWWLGYLLAHPVRRIWQEPRVILAPFVSEGMLVLEPGCGMGFFTIELARLVGPHGKVLAVDLQPRMLAGLQRRARRAGVESRIETRLASCDIPLAAEGVRAKWQPTAADLQNCEALGRKVAAAVKAG